MKTGQKPIGFTIKIDELQEGISVECQVPAFLQHPTTILNMSREKGLYSQGRVEQV